ncbi:MAG TPA: 50S ribosomal protein L30 [Gemmatimonadales bacterium]|jgi:large subunit ribosomal protein L30|nr:50S ribosomal protein L30 [Gemmatimonadales bacterium]
MGRNPAVGRQGPAHHAATIPSEQQASRIRVKQIRSGIGHPDTLRRTLHALGLQHHQMTVELPNNASVRGMLSKVRHLIDVTPL